MIYQLSNAWTVAILLLNLAGLSSAASRFLRPWLLARVTSPVLLCLVLFFVEHFAGLGRLSWVWPLTSAASAWLVWKDRFRLRQQWPVELAFLVGFGYALLWRFLLPNIDASSEKLADLGFINNYFDGSRLPPLDRWLPPFSFNVYYSFQHYCSAVLGRVLALDPGVTYNLSFCVIIGLTFTAAAGAAFLFSGRRWAAALVAFAFLAGGTGAVPITQFMVKDQNPVESMRFIGGTATPERTSTPFGRWLLRAAGVPAKDALELPAETFSYLAQLGDHHPPLSGFFLLALALLSVGLIESGTEARWAHVVLAATIPLTLISNLWSFPLQAGLVLFWALYRIATRQRLDAPALALGFLGALLLASPFLQGFAFSSRDSMAAMKWVIPGEHTAALLGMLIFYPMLVICAAQAGWGGRRLGLWLTALWIGLLVASELVFIDDLYSGRFNRFNTALKWWPWIFSGALLSLGSLNLTAKSRLCRWLTLAMLLPISSYSLVLAKHIVRVPKSAMGQLHGAAWITGDPAEKPMLEYLKAQPPGIVLQRLEAGAFTPAPALTMFARQTAFLGWPEHEKLWRGRRTDIDIRSAEVTRFYRGELPDSSRWLVQNGIDCVLWLKGDNALPGASYDAINQQIGSTYYWREFYRAGEFRVGMWTRTR